MGACGVLLLGALFLPWYGDPSSTAWESSGAEKVTRFLARLQAGVLTPSTLCSAAKSFGASLVLRAAVRAISSRVMNRPARFACFRR